MLQIHINWHNNDKIMYNMGVIIAEHKSELKLTKDKSYLKGELWGFH